MNARHMDLSCRLNKTIQDKGLDFTLRFIFIKQIVYLNTALSKVKEHFSIPPEAKACPAGMNILGSK